MSINPHAPQKGDGIAVTLLALPFLALDAAAKRVAAAITKKSKSIPKAAPAAKVAQRMPDITANQQYMIADRVFSAEVCGRQVSFFQYFAANVIRISCRELRHVKPIEFTPDIADNAGLIYDVDGAIQWVRKNGLEAGVVKRAGAKAQERPGKRADDAAGNESTSRAAKGGPESAPPNAALLNIVPETGSKGAPFVGRIVSFGITKRSGGPGKQPYTTYAMKLESESGSYEKEFIGEHLSDLVTELGLKPRQLVRIQLLGKHHFEVEVDGKMQARSRNHFSITSL